MSFCIVTFVSLQYQKQKYFCGMIKKAMYLFMAVAMFASCGQSQGTAGGIQTIDAAAFSTGIQKDSLAYVIDVRTPEEFNNEHLANALNYNINDNSFESRIGKLDTNLPVYVYCLAGSRSARAAETMLALGFKNIYNLSGGIGAWHAAGLPLEKGNAYAGPGMDKAAFEKLVNKGDTLVFVDFNAKWCGPCKKMLQFVPKVQKQFADKAFTVVKVDYDNNKQIVTDLGGEGVPYLLLYKKGKQIWKAQKEITETELTELVRKKL